MTWEIANGSRRRSMHLGKDGILAFNKKPASLWIENGGGDYCQLAFNPESQEVALIPCVRECKYARKIHPNPSSGCRQFGIRGLINTYGLQDWLPCYLDAEWRDLGGMGAGLVLTRVKEESND